MRTQYAKPPFPEQQQPTPGKSDQIDILVNNAARRASFNSAEEISDEVWNVTFRTNMRCLPH